MKMKNAVAGLLAVLLLSPAWVSAQQVPQSRKWTAQNQKYVTFTSEGAHFLPRDPKDGPNTTTTALHLAPGKPWEVDFDVQMIPTPGGGMSVHLAQGAVELCWLGAGDYYKHISGFLSSGADKMPFDQPWDDHWHSFSYKSDGKMLSLWHNGTKCGETPFTETPDTLSIQSIGMELRVKDIHILSEVSDVVALDNGNASQSPKTAKKISKPVRVASKSIVTHSGSGSKSHHSLQTKRPMDYPPMADGSPRPDGMTDASAGQLSIARSLSKNSPPTQPSVDLKRAVEDYQIQIGDAQSERDLYTTRLNLAVEAHDEKIDNKANAERKIYQQQLRDLVTTFATLRAMPGYAEHYTETAWIIAVGDTADVPGASGLKYVVAR